MCWFFLPLIPCFQTLKFTTVRHLSHKTNWIAIIEVSNHFLKSNIQPQPSSSLAYHQYLTYTSIFVYFLHLESKTAMRSWFFTSLPCCFTSFSLLALHLLSELLVLFRYALRQSLNIFSQNSFLWWVNPGSGL
jgi:hypothetical protein